ncbi:hypothetical protein Tco_1236694 [Tanacetum coccineum]
MAELKNAIALLRLSIGSSVERSFGTARPELSCRNTAEVNRIVVVKELLKTVDCTEVGDWCRMECSYHLSATGE